MFLPREPRLSPSSPPSTSVAAGRNSRLPSSRRQHRIHDPPPSPAPPRPFPSLAHHYLLLPRPRAVPPALGCRAAPAGVRFPRPPQPGSPASRRSLRLHGPASMESLFQRSPPRSPFPVPPAPVPAAVVGGEGCDGVVAAGSRPPESRRDVAHPPRSPVVRASPASRPAGEPHRRAPAQRPDLPGRMVMSLPNLNFSCSFVQLLKLSLCSTVDC
jgi:hypothetical protein